MRALAAAARKFVAWSNDREERHALAAMNRAFQAGCEVVIVPHGCHRLPAGTPARIIRADVDAGDYLIQLSPPLPAGAMTIMEGQTYVCPKALRRADGTS